MWIHSCESGSLASKVLPLTGSMPTARLWIFTSISDALIAVRASAKAIVAKYFNVWSYRMRGWYRTFCVASTAASRNGSSSSINRTINPDGTRKPDDFSPYQATITQTVELADGSTVSASYHRKGALGTFDVDNPTFELETNGHKVPVRMVYKEDGTLDYIEAINGAQLPPTFPSTYTKHSEEREQTGWRGFKDWVFDTTYDNLTKRHPVFAVPTFVADHLPQPKAISDIDLTSPKDVASQLGLRALTAPASAGRGIADLAVGLGKGVVDLGELSWRLNNVRAITDPDGYKYDAMHALSTAGRYSSSVITGDQFFVDRYVKENRDKIGPSMGFGDLVDYGKATWSEQWRDSPVGPLASSQRLLLPGLDEDPVRSITAFAAGFAIPTKVPGLRAPKVTPHAPVPDAPTGLPRPEAPTFRPGGQTKPLVHLIEDPANPGHWVDPTATGLRPDVRALPPGRPAPVDPPVTPPGGTRAPAVEPEGPWTQADVWRGAHGQRPKDLGDPALSRDGGYLAPDEQLRTWYRSQEQGWGQHPEEFYFDNWPGREVRPAADTAHLPELRQGYVREVRGLGELEQILRAEGKSPAQIARLLHAERRELGARYKSQTPAEFLEQIYGRNIREYGDPLGPSYEYLSYLRGKTDPEIIASAQRPGGADLGLGARPAPRPTRPGVTSAEAIRAGDRTYYATPIGGRGRIDSHGPHGPVRLGKPLTVRLPQGQKSLNEPEVIGGREYSGHALDRMQEQGFMPAVVEHVISQPGVPGKYPGTLAHYDPVNDITAIVNDKTGKVITVDYGNLAGRPPRGGPPAPTTGPSGPPTRTLNIDPKTMTINADDLRAWAEWSASRTAQHSGLPSTPSQTWQGVNPPDSQYNWLDQINAVQHRFSPWAYNAAPTSVPVANTPWRKAGLIVMRLLDILKPPSF